MIHPQARIAANIARQYPSIGREAANRLAARFGVPASILTLARILAEAERAGSAWELMQIKIAIHNATR
jgi:hypothetical protein